MYHDNAVSLTVAGGTDLRFVRSRRNTRGRGQHTESTVQYRRNRQLLNWRCAFPGWCYDYQLSVNGEAQTAAAESVDTSFWRANGLMEMQCGIDAGHAGRARHAASEYQADCRPGRAATRPARLLPRRSRQWTAPGQCLQSPTSSERWKRHLTSELVWRRYQRYISGKALRIESAEASAGSLSPSQSRPLIIESRIRFQGDSLLPFVGEPRTGRDARLDSFELVLAM